MFMEGLFIVTLKRRQSNHPSTRKSINYGIYTPHHMHEHTHTHTHTRLLIHTRQMIFLNFIGE